MTHCHYDASEETAERDDRAFRGISGATDRAGQHRRRLVSRLIAAHADGVAA